MGVPYFAPGDGWVNPYLPWYGDDSGRDDSLAAPTDAPDGYDAPPQWPGQATPSQPSSDTPLPTPLSEEGVTLIFKDGRTPVQIHNFVLTRTEIFVGDEQHRVIPTDLLDLAATAKVNQEAGVDFQLPEARK